MESQTYVFFGIAGSGKGTQVKLLMDLLKSKDNKEIIYAYPGFGFRKLIEGNSYLGKIIKESVNNGDLQPAFITNSIFGDLILDLSPDKHLVVDGYPRVIDQAMNFAQVMDFYHREDLKIIFIELPKEEALKRMTLRARPDDTAEGIENRFKEYEENVVPAMNYLRDEKGYKIYKINGFQSIEDVHKDIVKALNLE